jgi:hypothetical protein
MTLRSLLAVVALSTIAPAAAQDDARTKQLRLLCAQLSGDLTDPGGIAAFRRCLTTHNPLGEIARDNNIGHAAPAADRPGAAPPKGFGHDSRSLLANGVDHFATRDGKSFYAIDKDSRLWRWNPSTKESVVVDQNAADFASVDDTHLFVLGTDGHLSVGAGDGTNRVPVDATVASFQPVGAVVYVRGTDGKLWREHGDMHQRSLVDEQVVFFQAIDDNLVYVLDRSGKLWREHGDARDRAEIAGPVIGFQYVPDGDVTYVLAKDGTLWRQQGDKGKAEQVDHGVAAFQALDMHLAYVLGQDGRLWRELGNRDQALLVDGNVLAAAGRAAFQAADPQHVYVLGNDHQLWAETMPAGR